MKLCFISYARNNNADGRLGRFVDALEKQLLQLLPNGTSKEELAFFDVRSIESGEQWMERLADATRQCRVCVCFYSLPYFTSEYCGRELAVFMQRLQDWQKLPAATGKRPRAIVPVIWVPEKVPAALEPLQDSDAAYPAKYRQEGLLSLAMRKSGRDAYNGVLQLLAGRIATALKDAELPAGAPIASFGAITSVFHPQKAQPRRYGVALLVLADRARRRRPFAQDTLSLDALVDQVLTPNAIPLREIDPSAKLGDVLKASEVARELLLVLADPASLASPHNVALVKQLDDALPATATVALFGDPAPDSATALGTLDVAWASCLPNVVARSGMAGFVRALDSASLAAELERRLLKARHELILADPPRRAEDATLAQAAAVAGIALAARPILTGPGR